MNDFTIKDIEDLTGIRAHTIRVWEQRYGFLKPQRTDTNIRYYNGEELKAILDIALLNRYGVKISHIDKMSSSELKEKLVSFTGEQVQMEKKVNVLIGYMTDLELNAFEAVLNGFILSDGIDKTITRLILPFLDKTGLLWHENNRHPVHENLVNSIIRRKLVKGIDHCKPDPVSGPSVLLFLPEGAYYETGLLYACYLMKKQGIKILYLGADVPLKDVEFVAKTRKPDYLYTHLDSVPTGIQFEKLFNILHDKSGTSQLILSGKLHQSWQKKVPPGIRRMRSSEEIHAFIAGL